MAPPGSEDVRPFQLDIRYRMQTDPDTYFEYFESLLDGIHNLTADITPSYSGLARDRLRYIKNGFEKRDILTKVVVLIRNPVERIKSAVRYNLDKKNYHEGIKDGETDFLRALSQYYLTDHCRLRTEYDRVISNAIDVFGDSHVHIGIYENMFERSEIERLSHFLGVMPKAELSSVPVNRTGTKIQRADELEAKIADAYRHVYDFCFRYYPITRKHWKI